jgi:hypothetical protein
VAAGPDYPPHARVGVERYWYCLERARSAGSRAQAAARARSAGQAAGEVAAALAGCPQSVPAAHADPLAWAGISVALAALATALDGTRADDAAGSPAGAWADMAQAATRAEFAAAWVLAGGFLRRCAGLDGGQPAGGDGPWMSAFTAGQVMMAAAVLLSAPW